MTNKIAGWVLGLAALGMMFGLMSIDFVQMKDLNEIKTPAFIGNQLGHIANVIMAFVGGKLIPTEPQTQRIEDKKD